MQLTDQQKKFAWIIGVAAALYLFVPVLSNTVRGSFAIQQVPAAGRKPSPAHVVAAPVQPPADPAIQQASATAAQFDKLAGDWTNAAIMQRGLCRMALQIRTVPDKPGMYTGYSSTSCNPSLALSGRPASRENIAKDAINAMTPTQTIMTGKVENGHIVFHIDEAIGTPPDGCTMTGFRVSPFADQIAVQWDDGSCKGGQMVLNRVTNLR